MNTTELPSGPVERIVRGQRRASAVLVVLARRAAELAAKAAEAQRNWAEAFESEYGHSDISDALVQAVDYGGDPRLITAEFIAENSAPGQS